MKMKVRLKCYTLISNTGHRDKIRLSFITVREKEALWATLNQGKIIAPLLFCSFFLL